MMLRYAVSLVVLGLLGVFSLLSAIYCAWLTATPLTPERLHIVQMEVYVWFAVFIVTLVTSVVIFRRMLRTRHAEHSSQITPAA
jgi:hypothetical protein